MELGWQSFRSNGCQWHGHRLAHGRAELFCITVIIPMQVGEERSIVSPMSGTTRDAIDTDLTTPDGKRFTLIDTAGIRKRTAVASSDDGAEPLSVNRALQAIRWVSVHQQP